MKKSDRIIAMLIFVIAILCPRETNHETYVSQVSQIPRFMRDKEMKLVYGHASWYGESFHGRLTSSREIYNMFDLTVAHRKWSFGTYLKIENTLNGKSVVARVNDRGPYIAGRIIDVSYGTAKALDMIEKGVVMVKITILKN